MQKSAVIVDHFWRYRLDRIWDLDGKGTVAFVMLNPSTANAEHDDATIRRCVGYAKTLGYGHLVVVNLYGYRATNPKDLLRQIAEDEGFAIGAGNDAHVLAALQEANLVVAAWGANAPASRVEAMHCTFRALRSTVFCLGWTRKRAPVHPLRQPREAPLSLYWQGDRLT